MQNGRSLHFKRKQLNHLAFWFADVISTFRRRCRRCMMLSQHKGTPSLYHINVQLFYLSQLVNFNLFYCSSFSNNTYLCFSFYWPLEYFPVIKTFPFLVRSLCYATFVRIKVLLNRFSWLT